LHRELADRGFSVLAVDVSNDRPRTKLFYDQFGFAIPTVFDTQRVAASQYKVSATPTTYLVDQEGRIVYRRYGYLPGEEIRLREQVEALLARQ